ncbi:hypothetical protein V6R21_06705 [Limibacter armeniacum]|uniref:hypothetical protein n=1 Tax=Limibacter armeniacum TaxID=466084 RepID=UPI002FE67368
MRLYYFFILTLSYFLLLNTASLKAQHYLKEKDESPSPDELLHTMFVEFGGNGILYSLNYDFRLTKGTNRGFGTRIGLSSFSIKPDDNKSDNANYIAIPLMLNYLIGKKRHFLEIGFRATPFFFFNAKDNTTDATQKTGRTQLVPFWNLGYRYQSRIKENLIRIMYTPAIREHTFTQWGRDFFRLCMVIIAQKNPVEYLKM